MSCRDALISHTYRCGAIRCAAVACVTTSHRTLSSLARHTTVDHSSAHYVTSGASRFVTLTRARALTYYYYAYYTIVCGALAGIQTATRPHDPSAEIPIAYAITRARARDEMESAECVCGIAAQLRWDCISRSDRAGMGSRSTHSTLSSLSY